MEIRTGVYKNDQQALAYFDLVKALYQEKNGFAYFYEDLKKALRYTLESSLQQSRYIAVMEGDLLLAHLMLIEDQRLPEAELFFGFFECREEGESFHLLWKETLRQTRALGAKILHGPVNGSIWHAYRVTKSSRADYPAFNSEPLTQAWYYSALNSLAPAAEIGYHSASRKDYDFITRYTESSWQKARAEGFRIEEAGSIDRKLLMAILDLSDRVFSDSWCYTALSMDEFVQLYSPNKIDQHIGVVYLLKKGEVLAGFCSTVRDKRKLILKTIAVHPEYQQLGLGNALVHKVHYEAQKEKIPEIVYALIRDTNKVQHFPKDDVVIFREYACFTFQIP